MLVHRVPFFLKTIESHTKLDQPGFYPVRICAKSSPGRAAISTISTSIAREQFSSFIQSAQTRVAGKSARALSRRRIILVHLQSRGLSRRSSTMAGTSARDNDDISYSRPQQSPLASQRGKQNAGPSESNQSQAARSGGFFPLGFKEGFSQWWTSIPSATAEHRVMSYIPHLRQPPTQTESGNAVPSNISSPSLVSVGNGKGNATVTTEASTDPFGPRQWHSNLVKLGGKDRALNEFSVERIGEEVDENLVMLHGYGAGLGFFYKNFEGLSRVTGWKIYALDLLGMGRSSRPTFRIHTKDRQGSIAEAEDWFIDALEEWRVQKKIDRFTLLGHSLGGYMAVAYALKYPGHLNKLVLASPVGIPEDPYAVNSEMPGPSDSTLANEFTQDQDDMSNRTHSRIPESAKEGDNNNFLNARSNGQKTAKTDSAPARRPLPKWLTYLWEANIVSPFSLVRWGGPLGPTLVSGWTSRRFSHLPTNESQALHDYAYSLFRQRGSSEYALTYLLAPGAFARSPLIRRIHGVGRQIISTNGSTTSSLQAAERGRENGIPIVLMYGEHDWMDIAGGYAAEQRIKEERENALKKASAEEREHDQGTAKVLIIKKAGHHVYLDGWEEFNAIMRDEMVDVSKRKKSIQARLDDTQE